MRHLACRPAYVEAWTPSRYRGRVWYAGVLGPPEVRMNINTAHRSVLSPHDLRDPLAPNGPKDYEAPAGHEGRAASDQMATDTDTRSRPWRCAWPAMAAAGTGSNRPGHPTRWPVCRSRQIEGAATPLPADSRGHTHPPRRVHQHGLENGTQPTTLAPSMQFAKPCRGQPARP
jgi:hypothetical protein